MRHITEAEIAAFEEYLIGEERARATVAKYLRDVRDFYEWIGDGDVCKVALVAYKEALCDRYAPASVNAAISSLNGFFRFLEWHDLRVKSLRIQRQIFAAEEKELSRGEYERLLEAAGKRGNERLCLLMQTICSTGIRVSEVQDITVSAVERGYAEINCKGKRRRVLLPKRLCSALRSYARKRKIKGGAVFVTRNGNPLDRSNIWSEMKQLCRAAGVSAAKVFPHNLRHLFARTYYSAQKDIVRLADLLGHSSVNTTRIYTMETGEVHRRQIQELGLLRC